MERGEPVNQSGGEGGRGEGVGWFKNPLMQDCEVHTYVHMRVSVEPNQCFVCTTASHVRVLKAGAQMAWCGDVRQPPVCCVRPRLSKTTMDVT